MYDSNLNESISALLQQFAECKPDACKGALLHKRKKRRSKLTAKEREVRRLVRLLAKLLMKAIRIEGTSPPQIVLKIENHFHGRVEQINQ
jgi:hypothetical protein